MCTNMSKFCRPKSDWSLIIVSSYLIKDVYYHMQRWKTKAVRRFSKITLTLVISDE